MSRQMNEFEEKALNEFNSQVIDGMIWDSEIDKWVPEEDYKDKLTVFHDTDAPSTAGSSLKGYLYGPSYSQLVNFLGEPTFGLSGDEKCQVEWVVEFNDELFTIYDWKTYSEYETKNNLYEWNVGGFSYAGELIDYLKVQIDKLELPF